MVVRLLLPLFVIFILLIPERSFTQGPPPALITVATVKSGTITPETEFIGTVYYQEVSEVAAEVRGLIEGAGFEEGRRVRKGDVLVSLSTDLLEKEIESTRANYEESLAGLEKAKVSFMRIKALYEEKLASGQAYDDSRLTVESLERRAASLKASLEGLLVELGKKSVKAPFDGVIVKKRVERGEWVEPGMPVATLAAVDTVDIVADVPEEVMRSVREGMEVTVSYGGGSIKGRVFAIVPRGDIKTRTFPVKIRVRNNSKLAEGMDAKVVLPSSRKIEALIVPRDAVTTKFGMTVVFVVSESKASMVPVKVLGYSGVVAGIESPGIKEGATVAVKGNERLSDGQQVNVTGGK